MANVGAYLAPPPVGIGNQSKGSATSNGATRSLKTISRGSCVHAIAPLGGPRTTNSDVLPENNSSKLHGLVKKSRKSSLLLVTRTVQEHLTRQDLVKHEDRWFIMGPFGLTGIPDGTRPIAPHMSNM